MKGLFLYFQKPQVEPATRRALMHAFVERQNQKHGAGWCVVHHAIGVDKTDQGSSQILFTLDTGNSDTGKAEDFAAAREDLTSLCAAFSLQMIPHRGTVADHDRTAYEFNAVPVPRVT